MAFAYKRSITIDHTKCGSSDSSNFPVLVKISDATFKTVGNGGHIQNSNGYDIAFYSDSGLTSSLFWEIDYYDGVNGVLWAWVKVSTVSHSSDTVIYAGYGDATISTFQSTASSVWDSNYAAVYHFANGTTLSTTDSTSNGINLTNPGSAIIAGTGQVDGAASGFNQAANSYLGTASTAAINSASNITLSIWEYHTSSNRGEMITKYAGGTPTYYMYTYPNGSNDLLAWYSGGAELVVSAGNISHNAWHYIVAEVNSAGTTVTYYADGALYGSTTITAGSASTQPLNIGASSNSPGGNAFNGSLDEVRISTGINRSADWITTEYNNQNAPATFLIVGSETAISAASTFGRLFGLFQAINRSNTY